MRAQSFLCLWLLLGLAFTGASCTVVTGIDVADVDVGEVCVDEAGLVACGAGVCRTFVAACLAKTPGACAPPNAGGVDACDGLDDDCDGLVDEDCTCSPGTSTCYRGPSLTENVGLCHSGLLDCTNKIPGTCLGDVLPVLEVCNGLDDDCDGAIDEDCSCQDGTEQACFGAHEEQSGVGVCQTGVQTCKDGHFGSCVGQILPSEEICDFEDDDCNGVLDDLCN